MDIGLEDAEQQQEQEEQQPPPGTIWPGTAEDGALPVRRFQTWFRDPGPARTREEVSIMVFLHALAVCMPAAIDATRHCLSCVCMQSDARAFVADTMVDELIKKCLHPDAAKTLLDENLKQTAFRYGRFLPTDINDCKVTSFNQGLTHLMHQGIYPQDHFMAYPMCDHCHHIFTSAEPAVPDASGELVCPNTGCGKPAAESKGEFLYR